MVALPQVVNEAWDEKTGPTVMVTVDENGIANAIYVKCVEKYDDSTLVVADNYFDKTRKNIVDGGKGCLLFINEDNKAYQLKGTFEYHTSGPVFDFMKTWNPERHPGHAAAALKVEEIYCGAEKLA